MQVEDFEEREILVDGWPVRLTSYRLDARFICQADNVSPGACLARFAADTSQEDESNALSKARHLLQKPRRHQVKYGSASALKFQLSVHGHIF